MSLFGLSMGEFDDDLGIMGSHMNAMNMQMRSMNRLMNSLMPDPFNMLAPFDPGFQHQNALMERGQPMGGMGMFPAFPAMPNMNRLLSADIGPSNGASYCSSSVISMSAGPDGRPQYYQATSSTKTGPGGVRETRKTMQDSRSGVKKMAIGHHIGERAHIIEKEQDLRSGQLEERQEFINLDEEEAEQFDREFTTRATRNGSGNGVNMARAIQAAPSNANGGGSSTLTIEPLDDSDDDEVAGERQQGSQRYLPALPAPPTAPPAAASSQHNSTATTATTSKQATELPISTTRQALPSSSRTSSASSSSSSAAAAAAAATTRTATTMPSSCEIDCELTDDQLNNNYLFPVGQRARPYFRSYHLTPRRPLRTPSSSPLATTPTPTSAAHHHHPYNNAAAARRQQRKSHSQQQQQQQQQQQPPQEQFHLQGVQIPTTSASQQQTSKSSRHSAGASSTVATKKNRH